MKRVTAERNAPLRPPERVLEATAEYREESDPVGAFLTECAIVTGAEDDFIHSRDLIEAFNFWLEDRGETRWGGRTVSNRLKQKASRWRHPQTGKNFIPGKRGATGYRGIRLSASALAASWLYCRSGTIALPSSVRWDRMPSAGTGRRPVPLPAA
ncbi:primase-like DNA-binding domain-containing protein [Rhodovulum viride]|uniref:primase-like DNA-binding domain-containing protein n=1 Tax=Rhodovulum viride TaxID=1231134 RepID=UPI001FE4E367|nr:primase-like DNA-binding domain-containing protein [Rhodovulum viride]